MTRVEINVGRWLEEVASHSQENADNSIGNSGPIGKLLYLYWTCSAHFYANLADRANYSSFVTTLEEIESSLQSTEEALTTIAPHKITQEFRQIPNKLAKNQKNVEYDTSYSTDSWMHETSDGSLIIWSVYDEGNDRRVSVKFGKSASDHPQLDDENATNGMYFENQTYSEYILDSTQLWKLPLCGTTSAKVYRYSQARDKSAIPTVNEEVEDLSTIEWLNQLKNELPTEFSKFITGI